MHDYKFSLDWFSGNIPAWNRIFKPYKAKPVEILEVGSYEGRSAMWLLDNILTHKDAKITCIDNFADKVVRYHGERVYNPDTLKNFKHNAKFHPGKITLLQGHSGKMLRKLKPEQFSVIYLDANTYCKDVLEQAVLAFPLLKKGGLLIFDDYTYSKEHDTRCPRMCIDAFLNVYAKEIQVIQLSWQVIVRKRHKILPDQECFSEYFKEPRR